MPSNIKLTMRNERKTSIYLNGNDISDLDMSELNQSQIINLHSILENFDLYLDGNPLNCGCKTHRMFQYLVSASQTEQINETKEVLPDFSFYEYHWKCTKPSMWAGIPLMQIPEYEYNTMCDTLEPCPYNCLCYHSWKLNDTLVANCSHDVEHVLTTLPVKLPNLTTNLYMSQSNLQSLCSFHDYFRNLQILDLSLNKIDEICPEILSYLGNVKELSLARNELEQLPTEIELMTKLTKHDLSNNLLEELPKSVQNIAKLKDLDISGNKFRCDCDTFWMTEWLANSLADKVKVKDSYSIVCVSGKGQGKHLIDLNQNDLGCNDPLIHALIGLAVTFSLIAIMAIVIYKYKGYIKVWLYARFGFHPWDNVKENPEEKDYDAFVSFCRKDENWVLKTLLPYLEAPQCGFHLCVHDRDFVPGAAITKNITTAIEYSRRTILVLTPDFIKSGWCDFEFQTAHKRSLDDRSNFLIVVVLKEVDEKDLDETLKFYMKTNTYVTVNDKWFWQKMQYAMPKVPIDKLKALQNIQDKNDDRPKDAPLPEDDVTEQNHVNDDAMLITIDEHHPGNNQQGNMEGAAVHYHDHISDVSSSGGDLSRDSGGKEFDKYQLYQCPAPCSNRNAVDKLPPLFKCIHTYKYVQ